MASASHRVPEIEAVEGVLGGVKNELSRNGALASQEGYPRVYVEVLRVDEVAAGIVAPEPAPGAPRRPLGRGASVAVTARAWVEESRGSVILDTGDFRRVATVEAQPAAWVDAQVRRAAVRAAAREVGAALGRRILGEPEPTIESL